MLKDLLKAALQSAVFATTGIVIRESYDKLVKNKKKGSDRSSGDCDPPGCCANNCCNNQPEPDDD